LKFFECIVLGVSSGKATPDPIPNSAVKLASPDGSYLFSESRTMPRTMYLKLFKMVLFCFSEKYVKIGLWKKLIKKG
jgi:hypothetical protein